MYMYNNYYGAVHKVRHAIFHSFIHSGHFYSAPSSPLLLRGAPDYSIGVSRRSAQATAGKGLAQGFYVAARAGIEPTTLRLKVIVSTKAPPRPTTWWCQLLANFDPSHLSYFSDPSSQFLVVQIKPDKPPIQNLSQYVRGGFCLSARFVRGVFVRGVFVRGVFVRSNSPSVRIHPLQRKVQ